MTSNSGFIRTEKAIVRMEVENKQSVAFMLSVYINMLFTDNRSKLGS